jgi:acyl carrier protein
LPGPPITEPSAELVDEVLGVVRQLLIDAVGPEYEVAVEIELSTSFDRDLELESLELVALNELLHERYGDHLDFAAWLADMELEEIVNLTVGDLVSFIAGSLSDAAEPPPE